MIRMLMVLMMVLPLCACSFGKVTQVIKRDRTIDLGPTLAELPEQAIVPAQALKAKTLEEITAAYHRALAVSSNAQINQRILMRLADLNLIQTEDRMIASSEAKQYFGDVIDVYQALLQTSTELGVDPERRQQLQYQLAKAYALDGRMEESIESLSGVAAFGEHNQLLLVEAKFRRGEHAFSNDNFYQAQQDFKEVVLIGESNFYENAIYMLGWTEFKIGNYEASLATFTQLLDRYAAISPALDDLPSASKTLLDDSLRAMSIAFSYLEGGISIAKNFATVGQRDYEYLLYRNLGNFYLGQTRYEDAAQTYNTFVNLYPFSRHAPDFTVATIDVYSQGDFPSLALEQKQFYLDRYGIDSPFYVAASEADREPLNHFLHRYLIELANYVHAEAQALDKQQKQSKKIKRRDVTQRYLDAAERYDQFVRTFPNDPKTPEMVYLMAEAFTDARAYVSAATAFEKAAYDYLDSSYSQLRAADAAYAAVLMANEVVKQQVDEGPRASWQLRKTALSIRFADTFANDPRAVSLLTSAAEQLLKAGNQQQAVAAAYRVVEWVPLPEGELLKTAWLVAAQGNFDLAQYEKAEAAYTESLALLSNQDSMHAKVEENLAASIYKQAEHHVSEAQLSEAVDDFLRIYWVLPKQPLAAQGQFDALNYLVELERWQEAEETADLFVARFSRHALRPLIPAKQLLIYERSEQWRKAAAILYRMHLRDKDPEVQRTSLYLAAEYALKDGDTANAINYFRRYAHRYDEPFDILIEAQFHMVQLYQQTGDAYRERYWLKKIIAATERKSRATARSNYLRAYALMAMAEDSFIEFSAAKLTLPLKQSLAVKRKTMAVCTENYAKVIELGVAEFTTKANYRMAEVYLNLSEALMDAPRPRNLDALALEQYEILLEEQAFPFEEKAIVLHEANSKRTQAGVYDEWVKKSFADLATILPARYGKREQRMEASDAIF